MKRPAAAIGLSWPVVLTVIGLVLVIGGYVRASVGAERVISEGRQVVLELGPRDPRAFLTGDYMVIRVSMATALDRQRRGAAQADDDRPQPREDGYVIVRPDARGVAQLVRLADRPAPLASDEMAIVGRHRRDGWRIGTDAFYFPEGQGQRYQAARFGDYRLGQSGELLLLRLLDANLLPLPQTEPKARPQAELPAQTQAQTQAQPESPAQARPEPAAGAGG